MREEELGRKIVKILVFDLLDREKKFYYFESAQIKRKFMSQSFAVPERSWSWNRTQRNMLFNIEL